MNRVRLSRFRIENSRAKEKNYFLRDTEVVGLCLMVTPKNRKSWYLETTVAGRNQRRKIGSYPELNVDDARSIALANKTRIVKGEHPDVFRSTGDLRYVRDLMNYYLDQRLSEVSDQRAMERVANLVISKWGNTTLAGINRTKINRFVSETDLMPAALHHIIASFKAAWNVALANGKTTVINPLNKLTLKKPDIIAKSFTESQRIAFNEAMVDITTEKIEAGDSPFPAMAVNLLYLTGYRRNEILRINMEQFDPESMTITFHEHKTRTRDDRDKVLHLTPKAMNILDVTLELREALGASGTHYLFPSLDKQKKAHDKPLSANTLRRTFVEICERAGLKGFVLHNLRSNFVSTAIARGLTVDQISGITGQSPDTIRRHYVTHQPARVRENATLVTDGL